MSSFILRISKQDEEFKFSWTIFDGDDQTAPAAYSVDADLVQQAAEAVRQQLAVIAFATKPFEKAEFSTLLDRLAKRGQELFRQLMDPASNSSDLQQRFEQIAQAPSGTRHDLKIVLETEKLFLPWGLVFAGRVSDLPDQPTVSLADMMGFWLAHFSISIAYSQTKRFPAQRKTSARKLFALHEAMYQQARDLLKVDDPDCLDRLDRLVDDNMKPATDWDEFKAAWEKVGTDHDSILYFFGHSNGQRIELRDKKKGDITEADDPKYDLNASGLRGLRKNVPGDSAAIFLFNGCQTAAPTVNSPISASFLKAACDPGYFGFVGTETQVSNIFACRYGTEFLWRLYQDGRSVGEAFDELLAEKKLFPQNILYSCYADRKFRFVFASTTEKQ